MGKLFFFAAGIFDAVFPDFAVKSTAFDAELTRRRSLVSAVTAEGIGDSEDFNFAECDSAAAAGKAFYRLLSELSRQMLRQNKPAPAQHKCVFYGIFEFPYISGIIMKDKICQRCFGYTFDVPVVQIVKMPDKMVG